MRRLGFGPVKRSTLADANHDRPTAILEDLYWYMLGIARNVAPKKHGFRFCGDVLALDSTTIELCLSLSPWAQFHHSKGACKLHTAIDIAGELPQFFVLTPGRVHDLRVARQLVFQKGSTIVMDKAYVDYSWFNKLNQDEVYFVTRMKDNCQFKVVDCRKTNRTSGDTSAIRSFILKASVDRIIRAGCGVLNTANRTRVKS